MTETLTKPVEGAYAVDVSKGTNNTRVSSEWWNRPDDQRFCSVDELLAHTRGLRDSSISGNIDPTAIRVIAGESDNSDDLKLVFPAKTVANAEIVAEATHWSFGQIATLAKAPARYMRKLPSQIAGINLQHGLLNDRTGMVKALVSGEDDTPQVRAFTGPSYGRIYDNEVVEAVHKIAGNGTGDSRWKIPGTLNWSTGTYDPYTPITKATTTLFASDRDVFMFLVDDRNPIEIGTLANGNPDLVFRGFYIYNSEVGSKSFGIASMYLRGVCANRILWGVENFKETRFPHTSRAPSRFVHEVEPILNSYVEASPDKLLSGINAARGAVVADADRSSQMEFLGKRKFSKNEASDIIAAVTLEEGHEPRSVWDFVQGITAVARDKGRQDERVEFERHATVLLNGVVATAGRA